MWVILKIREYKYGNYIICRYKSQTHDIRNLLIIFQRFLIIMNMKMFLQIPTT